MSIGWRPVSTRITSANATAPHQCAGALQICQPAAAALIARRSVLCAGSAATSSASTQQRLAEHGDHQIPRGAHQREAVAGIPGGGRRREPRQRQQADEHERVMADAEVPGPAGERDEQHGGDQAGGDQRRREPVDGTGPLRVNGAL